MDYPAVVSFPGLNVNINELVEMKCYQTLQKIKAIVENDSFDDPECFMKIENIVCTLEGIGSDGGFRHDLG